MRCCDATTKKECARLDLDGHPCVIPEWVVQERLGFLKLGQKIKYAIHAVFETIFHHHDAVGR